MPSKPLLDLEALLTPIPGDNPAGAALRYTGDYDEIKALLPKPDRDAFEASGQEGQWSKLVQVTTQKLRDKSKDLTIGAWLTEGLVHLHGFAGLRDGLTLLHGLCDRFWDNVYPLTDEGDLEIRAAPLQSLLERNSPMWVSEISLTKNPIKAADSDDQIPVTYNLWHSIVIAQLEDKKPLQGPMDQAGAESPTDFLQRLYEDMEESESALFTLRQLMDDRFGSFAPGTTAVAEAIAKCKSRVATVLAKRGVNVGQTEESVGGAGAGSEEAASAGYSGGNGTVGGPINSREQALDKLREVADYFRRTEPHSPVPYLIQRAINWSRMSFDQLLIELVKDENSRLDINTTLGIKAESGGDASYSSQ
jgi:type VI secretion system protein ImpA